MSREKRQVLFSHDTESEKFLAVGDCQVFVNMPDDSSGQAQSIGTNTVTLQFMSPNPGTEKWVDWQDHNGVAYLDSTEGIIFFRGAPGIYYRISLTSAGPEATLVHVATAVRRIG